MRDMPRLITLMPLFADNDDIRHNKMLRYAALRC